MLTWAVVENVATLAACVALVLGSYALGAGGWSWIGLALLLNLNYPRRSRKPRPGGRHGWR